MFKEYALNAAESVDREYRTVSCFDMRIYYHTEEVNASAIYMRQVKKNPGLAGFDQHLAASPPPDADSIYALGDYAEDTDRNEDDEHPRQEHGGLAAVLAHRGPRSGDPSGVPETKLSMSSALDTPHRSAISSIASTTEGNAAGRPPPTTARMLRPSSGSP